MATFIEVCQDVARESGVIPNLPAPSSVVGQTGKLNRIVNWVDMAYRQIQNSQESWKWLYSEFDGPLIASLAAYEGSDLGLDRWARWHELNKWDTSNWTIRGAGETRASETRLVIVSPDFYQDYLNVGNVQTGRPTSVTYNDRGQLVVHPTPDAAYIIRGQYYKSPQRLTNDGDVPEMPVRFHDAIMWKALIMLATFDESPNQISNWNSFLTDVMDQLQSSQLPRVQMDGALA